MRYLCANQDGDPTAVALDSVAGQMFEVTADLDGWAVVNADGSLHRAGKLIEVPIESTNEACSQRVQLAGTDLEGPCVELKGHEGPHRTVRALT